jgi:hypothetical protein
VPERETAIVSRSGAARQGFPFYSGLAPDSSITRASARRLQRILQ